MSRFSNGTHHEFLKSQSSTPRVLHQQQQQQPGSSSSCYNMEDHHVMCNPTRNAASHPSSGAGGTTDMNILRDRCGSKFLDFRRIINSSSPSLVSSNSTFHQQLSSATDSSTLHERLRSMSSHGDHQQMSAAGMLMLHQLQPPPKVPSLSPTGYNSHSTCQFEPHDHPAGHGPHDDGSSAGNAIKPPPDHQPATMVPPAFNPVFWLLQGASASSSDHHHNSHQLHHHHPHPPAGAPSHQPATAGLPEIMLQHDQTQQLCHSANLENQQQQLPEIEMRLGPFAPPSSTSHHQHFHAGGGASGGFGSSVDTRGDLCSITANFHKGAPHGFLHDPNLDDVHGHMMSQLQGGQPYDHHVSWDDTSTRASSSTSNNSTDNISHTAAGTNQLQFSESSLHWAGYNGEKPSANSCNHAADDQMVRSSSTIDMISAGTSSDHPPCSNNTSTAQLSPDRQHDHHQLSGGGDLTVMKWCNLVSSQQEASTRGGAQVHHQAPENELHHPVKVLMLGDQTLMVNSRSTHHPIPQTPITWQIQHQGGQDMYYPSEGPVASMSPELQRMAAVLDQI